MKFCRPPILSWIQNGFSSCISFSDFSATDLFLRLSDQFGFQIICSLLSEQMALLPLPLLDHNPESSAFTKADPESVALTSGGIEESATGGCRISAGLPSSQRDSFLRSHRPLPPMPEKKTGTGKPCPLTGDLEIEPIRNRKEKVPPERVNTRSQSSVSRFRFRGEVALS
ncbi:hypothetical protein AXG93_2550s1430 [Marchantia polymorpha subsp. ruderalis]|uniref:Uncharacterized protein n=1 Tax=Marchantia polymorpha subsp. ruderalis TaxID=1480154 RepID=A0A176VLK0_MARPO|nr:hypothetical protein AXG93_2550s1430 [Marchantia polymorpha subsp. ruderalis]